MRSGLLSKRKTTIFRAVNCLLCLYLSACSNANRQLNTSLFPKTQSPGKHSSPFQTQKVILTQSSFKSINESDPSTVEGIKLVVTLDNTLAEKECTEGSSLFPAIVCTLVQSKQKKLFLKRQVYDFSLSKTVPLSKIQAWTTDPAVVGISNATSYKMHAFNDPLYSNQSSYLKAINFESSLPLFQNGTVSPAPVVVAVIDSGVAAHEDLGGSTSSIVIGRHDMRSALNQTSTCGLSYSDSNPLYPHGTFVSGIIAAQQNNNLGIAGIASNAQILSYTVGDCHGENISSSELSNSILAATQENADLINISLGGSSTDDPALRNAVVQALNAHIVIVASAGNGFLNLDQTNFFPAYYSQDYSGFITVGWGDDQGGLFIGPSPTTYGSNYSPTIVKIVAPGGTDTSGVVSTVIQGVFPGFNPFPASPGAYASAMGSSAAAPIVSGALALAIGFLRANTLSYDEGFLENLLIEQGVDFNASLSSYAKNGAYLDMLKLGQALQKLELAGVTALPVQVTNPSLSFDSNQLPQISFTANWNLPIIPYGARIGVFDGSPGCGFSEPCLIQDFAINGNSQGFNLGYADTLSVLPQYTDPAFSLNVITAIYYQVIDPSTGKPKNNYGIAAKANLNLRDFDNSATGSTFTGQVANIRMDQKYFYVSGWACVYGSNKAVPVRLLNTSGQPIFSDYAYTYPLMFPHGTPIDLSSFSVTGGPFLASGMMTSFKNGTSFLAGLEANPALIKKCQTLTTAQGFDFAVPISSLTPGTGFSVEATNPEPWGSGAKITLTDPYGNNQFTFPAVNYQQSLSPQVKVNRTGDTISLTGTLCSNSPNPIHLEISFSAWDLSCRLTQTSGFPTFNDPHSFPFGTPKADQTYNQYCKTGQWSPLFPPVPYDSATGNIAQQVTPPHIFTAEGFFPNGAGTQFSKLTWTAPNLSQNTIQQMESIFPSAWPNAAIFWRDQIVPGSVLSLGLPSTLVEIPSGLPMVGIQNDHIVIESVGPTPPSLISALNLARAGTSTPVANSLQFFWDYYDVGEQMTQSQVGYPIDTTKNVGKYLFDNYEGIKELVRETKKYETPLGASSQVLSNLVIAKASATPGGSCPFQFSFNTTISEISQYVPGIEAYIQAFLRQGDTPQTNIPTDPNVINAIRQVPLDLRFFQDGVMIQQLLTDYDSGITKVPVLGRGGN